MSVSRDNPLVLEANRLLSNTRTLSAVVCGNVRTEHLETQTTPASLQREGSGCKGVFSTERGSDGWLIVAKSIRIRERSTTADGKRRGGETR